MQPADISESTVLFFSALCTLPKGSEIYNERGSQMQRNMGQNS
jgi:hypothetical protein